LSLYRLRAYNCNPAMHDEATQTLAYLWQIPGKPVSVSLSLAVIDDLGDAVLNGSESPPRRGLEIGGLLLGKARRDRGRTVVEVDSFEPVECEHLAGPSYLLSRTDQERLASRIRGHKNLRGRSVVGFYRSNTRKNFALTVEDVDLMAAYLSEASKVFLLIQAHSDGPPTAGFAIWEGRDIRSRAPLGEFPFRSAVLLREGPGIQPRRSADRSSPLLPDLAALRTRAARFVQSPPARKTFQPSRTPRRPRTLAKVLPSVQLQPVVKFLSQLQERMKFGWIASVTLLAGAIVTGALLNGSRPEIASAPPRPPAAQERQAQAVRTVVPIAPEETAPVPPALPAETATLAAPPRLIEKPMEERARTAPAIPDPPVAWTQPAMAVPPPEPTLLPDPPEISARLLSNPEPLSTGSEILKPRMPSIPDRFVSVACDPLPESGRRGPFSKLPLVAKHRPRKEFSPPTPIREAPPEVPVELRQRIRQEVPIDVKLYVDRAGKVEFAELLSNGTGVNRDLASLAVFSSRHWQFSPAHLGDETVPAEVVLRFRFGPDVH
jgi:hypothetical protein